MSVNRPIWAEKIFEGSEDMVKELGAYLSRGALGSASLAETAWTVSLSGCAADVSLAYAFLQEFIFVLIPAASARLLATWVRTVVATAGPLAEELSCCMAAPVEEAAAAATILIPEEAICWDF